MASPNINIKGNWKLTTDPADTLVFEGPFAAETKVPLKLTNTDNKKQTYKVKCTSNKMFKIRPPIAAVGPNETSTVVLTCHPFEADEPIPTDGAHVFTVYHIPIPDQNDDQPRTVWMNHHGEPEGCKRLPVKFVQESDNPNNNNNNNDATNQQTPTTPGAPPEENVEI